MEIGDRDLEIIRELGEMLRPFFDGVVDGFYERIRANPDALSRFKGGESQILRQRTALRAWIEDLFQGDWGTTAVEGQQRIGAVHVNAGVDERLMVASMNWLRGDLAHAVAGLPSSSFSTDEACRSLNRYLDFSLAVMLSSYWVDLHERMQRTDRLAMIGRFAATINHELRNPLGVIGTSTYLLREHSRDADELTEKHFDKIERSLDRAQSIVSGMLEWSRIKLPEPERIDLREFVDSALETVALSDGIELELVDRGELNHGSFDRGLILHVLENVLRNANEALEKTGRIRIEWSSDAVETVIRVRDDGPGIAEEITDRIFEPLFTTKSFGTGLGLTLSRTLVEAHGGTFLAIVGIDDRGAGFEMKIPRFLGPRAALGAE